jgi:hypothetical protein
MRLFTKSIATVTGHPVDPAHIEHSVRFRIGFMVRTGIAIAALVAGIFLMKATPQFLLVLLPIEAMVACGLIHWNDCAVYREHDALGTKSTMRTTKGDE